MLRNTVRDQSEQCSRSIGIGVRDRPEYATSLYTNPKHLFLVATQYVEKINDELDKILVNPNFPDQVHILTESFKKLARTGLIELKKNYDKHCAAESMDDSQNNINVRWLQEYIESEKSTATKQLVVIFEYFKYLTELIRYIVTSSVETAPLGLIFPFQKIIESLFPKSYIFIRRQWKHNYKYGEFVNQIIGLYEEPEYFDKIKNEFNFRLCMVAYPSLEDDNYLYNCNVAHEVGHYVDDLNRIYGDEKTFIKDIDRDEYHTTTLDLETAKRKATYHWHQEFISDVYATYLLGPAYLFSFLEFHCTDKNIDKAFIYPYIFPNQRAYPSSRMRLFYILNALSYKKRDFKSQLNKSNGTWFVEVVKKLNELEENVDDKQFDYLKDDETGFSKDARNTNKELIEQVLEHAFNTIEPAHKRGFLADIEQDFNDSVLEQVMEKLHRKIPINELSKKGEGGVKTTPTSLFAIMNYGWMRFYEIMEGNDYSIEEVNKEIAYLKLLVRRSAEASYFHQQYNDYRDRVE